jgi:hypothetical protein
MRPDGITFFLPDDVCGVYMLMAAPAMLTIRKQVYTVLVNMETGAIYGIETPYQAVEDWKAIWGIHSELQGEYLIEARAAFNRLITRMHEEP